MSDPEDSTTSTDERQGGYAKQWQSIDWLKAENIVRRLQCRISKAAIADNWNLVSRLQHLLVTSFSARALAVKQVTSTKGRASPGVDGVIWNTPSKKMKAVLSLTAVGYHPKPLRRVYIPKSNGKLRPLSIPTMYDRAMQALYNLALDPVQEATADPNSYGFRKGRSAQDAQVYLRTVLGGPYSARWVLEGDIKGCFDNISHEWLMENIPMDKRVLGKFLKAGFVFENGLFPTERGTPQGGVISPTLANMTLNGMEKLIREHYPKGSKVNFTRYADDWVATCPSPEVAADVKELLSKFLNDRGLELSQEKTLITHISEGFDFLGWNLRKHREDGMLVIRPSRKSVERIMERVRDVVLGHGKAEPQKTIIKNLNPILRGWANYHRFCNSKRTFSWVGNYVFNTLWRWARRKHSGKHLFKVFAKYWHPLGKRKWVFSYQDHVLYRIETTSIRRHIKSRSDKNPYIDFVYFDERRKLRSTNRGWHTRTSS